MKQILGVLGVLVALAQHSADAGTLQKSDDGSLYYIETEMQFNWFEALGECTRKNMSLIAIDSHSKHRQILAVIKKVPNASNAWFFTAGHDNAVTGRYEWISTGQRFGYTNWRQGEPNFPNEHCVTVYSDTLTWWDSLCLRDHGFICEMNAVVKEKTKELDSLRDSFDRKATQLMEKTKELNTMKQSSELLEQKYKAIQTQEMQFNQSLKEKTAELEGLKRAHEIQLKQKQEELDVCVKQASEIHGEGVLLKNSCGDSLKSEPLNALRQSIEMLTNQLYSEKNQLLAALIKSYEVQSNRTLANKYINIINSSGK